MKLAELEGKLENADERCEEHLGQLSMMGSCGSSEASDEMRDLFIRAMLLWDEVDEMRAYAMGVKSNINIPELGMSILEAEVMHSGMLQRIRYLRSLAEASTMNSAYGGLGEILDQVEDWSQGGEVLTWTCSDCEGERGVPMEAEDVNSMIEAVGEHAAQVKALIDQAKWNVEVSWVEKKGSEEAEAEEEPDPEVEPEAPQQEPQPESDDAGLFSVIDTRCPFCMSQGRGAMEKFHVANGNNLAQTTETAISNQMVPQGTSPEVARTHFERHFDAADHGLERGN